MRKVSKSINDIIINSVISKDKSARNTMGTRNSASDYPDPMRGPPKETTWAINFCHFNLGRPVTLLTSQPWPNRSIGPPTVQETPRLNTGKNKGGWRPKRQLNDTQSLRAPSSIELGRA